MGKGKDILIEFETSGNELDCKILNYQKYVDGKSDLYEDYDKYNIKRNFSNNKRYIKVIQSKNETEEINNIILSIFSKNVDHIEGPNISNLSYTIKYNSSLSNNYDENYAENSTENITEDTSEAPKKTKTTTTLLGFANFVYIREIKIVHFIVYFSSKIKIIYSEILIFSIKIIYKRSLRGLDEDNKKIQCNLIDYKFDNQNKYNCSFETNGEEIDNIEVNDDFDFSNQDIEVISKSSIAEQYLKNLQKIGDTDIFDNKKLYILDNSTISKDINNNKFNITGKMNNIDFNYENLDLTVKLLSSENPDKKTKNIPCKIIKLNDEDTSLQCISEEKMNATIDGSFSILEKDNLIVNLKDNENSNIIFASDISPQKIYPNYRKDKNSGLSTGEIIAIIIPCAIILLVVSLIIIIKCKPKPVNPVIDQTYYNDTKNNTSTQNINSK